MTGRLLAIGDIHGCSLALRRLLELIQPASDDTIVTLGDYVNRGPDSRGVLDQLMELRLRCRLIPLIGNHDESLLCNRATRTIFPGGPLNDPENGLELFHDRHFEFLQSCVLFHESKRHFFVHANYEAQLDWEQQDRFTMLWVSLKQAVPKPHRSGKIAIVGHTAQPGGEVLSWPFLKCIDTYCYAGRWLTALDVDTGQAWQVSREGVERAHPPRIAM